MIEKMSLDQFQQIKEQLSQLIEQYEDLDIHKNEKDYDIKSAEQTLIEQYLQLQNHLLSYDLSDIPFEAWKDLSIVSSEEYYVDFSKTRANIDFNIFEYNGNGNFKGCNIKNLDKIRQRLINPNEFDEQTIKNNSRLFLSNNFSDEIKNKYYNYSLTISDLAILSPEQLNELKQKNFKSHLELTYNSNLAILTILELEKAVQLYNYSKQEYDAINKVLSMFIDFTHIIRYEKSLNDNDYNFFNFKNISNLIKDADITKVKNICFDFAKQEFIDTIITFRKENFPEMFINENPDIFLENVNIPEEVKNRYFEKELQIQDILDYPEIFQNLSIEYFLSNIKNISSFIKNNYGSGKFQELLKKHPDVFLHIQQRNEGYKFGKFLTLGKSLDTTFVEAVKEYYLQTSTTQEISNIPEWLTSMNFKIVKILKTTNDFLQYNDSVLILDNIQRKVINILNAENLKRFEQETSFFTHKNFEWSGDLENFNNFITYFYHNILPSLKKTILSYDDFSYQVANCLDSMKNNNQFVNFNYDWIQGDFRNNHPEIFMDINAPQKLKKAFYSNNITLSFLYNHEEYIPYLLDKNLSNIIKANINLITSPPTNEDNTMQSKNFIEEYASRYGNEKLLQLLSKYGDILSNVTITSFNNEIEDEHAIGKSLRNSIYEFITGQSPKSFNYNYYYLSYIPEFVTEHPEIFTDFSNLINVTDEERERLTNAFYKKMLTFDDIKKYPELINILKNKDLQTAFECYNLRGYGFRRRNAKRKNDLIQTLGNENFLQLCSRYGRYMDKIDFFLRKSEDQFIDIDDNKIIEPTYEKISKQIENIIIRETFLGNIQYLPEDAPVFLKESHPELFLSEDAPEELKKYFYNYDNNYLMTFKILQKHKDWLPFLKDKKIAISLLKNDNLKRDMIKFFEVFGEEKAIKLGINRAETVEEMLKAHQVDLMKSWYDKTGGKFIPDFVVMQNFRLEEADKFLTSGSNWSNLMRIKSFAETQEGRDAMLKLAYSFGAFDQDQRGFKKLHDLLTNLPRKIDFEEADFILERVDQEINIHSHRTRFFPDSKSYIDINGNIHTFTSSKYDESYQKMIEYIKSHSFVDLLDTQSLLNLLESLKQENVDIDFSKNIFAQIYRKNEDNSYTLTISPQSYPKSTQAIRSILGNFSNFPIITPNRAHYLFGGFELKYDADFREFLLANMNKIIENPKYISLVSSIQRQFSAIKAINSNRSLTWELAVSYVQTNKFTSVNVGNERVAEISAIAGYSQNDFNTLQQIYNYGKQRTFSSIPRIEKTSGKYTYEMLRLDDPLAMAIGTLTDCCQELNNCAEVCMEHSMVDKNGRVFAIKDKQGNIVAQSWVWRNKDVLCFDNIEIPEKAFARVVQEHPELGRKGFTDEVFEIYKQAAHDLIETDEKVYKELLENGKITQEQYDGLRLGKITVGLGYNDIAESLKQNSVIDRSTISRPLPFEEPVKLSRGLYTNDSTTQYILEERENRKKFDGETLPVHNDSYIEYSDSNFTEKSLLSLKKLEVVTKDDPKHLEISISDYADSKHLVTEIASNYGLNPETTKIIMNPNFAIIYDVNGDKLKIGDLLFNTKVDNEQQQIDIENQVIIQIRLALKQIANNKEIDISALDEKQKEMYVKVTGLTEEIDIERGVGHAK